MKKTSLCQAPSQKETRNGFLYLAFELLFLPSLLRWCNGQCSPGLSLAELNFLYYLLNFLAVLLIFHGFLGENLTQVTRHPAYFCQAVILGLAAYYACFYALDFLMDFITPGFSNYNDGAIAEMSRGNRFLMLTGTVLLVPVAEESFFRGLIFRNLYGKSRWAAYLVSMVAFAAIHILGYIGLYSPLELIMAILQYLPAGLCLGWAYQKGGTIFAPILMHACINYLSFQRLR